MNSERYEKTISIPVIIKEGRIIAEEGQALPKLSENAYGNLNVPIIFFEDKDEQKILGSYKIIEILKKDTKVLVSVNSKFIPNDLKDSLIKTPAIKPGTLFFVEVVLKDNLRLKIRYNKHPKFLGCACLIPILNNQEAISLNHAYTLISQKYETKRKSHTGNVFDLCYVEKGDKWVPLDMLRY